MVRANDLYVSVPMTFEDTAHSPQYAQIGATMALSGSTVPRTGEIFNVTLSVTNQGEYNLSHAWLEVPEISEGLTTLSPPTIELIDLNAGASQVFTLTLKKESFLGYLVPQFKGVTGIQGSYVAIVESQPFLLGECHITVNKSFSTYDLISGRNLVVTITVQNTGTIEIGNVTLNDMWSFDTRGFQLVQGVMVHNIPLLMPDESLVIQYTIKAADQGWYSIVPAGVVYFFGHKNTFQSLGFLAKVRVHPVLQTASIWLVGLAGLAALYGVYRYMNRYDIEEYAFARQESLMFGASLRFKAWHHRNLTQIMLEEEERRNALATQTLAKSETAAGGDSSE
jgi:hypothetical protein